MTVSEWTSSGSRLAGKVVVVTGAARGLGAAATVALSAEGATVVAVARSEHPADETLQAVMAAGAPITYRRMDVTDPASWAALAADLATEHGQVHGLVNNAGVTHRATLLTVEVADLERVHRINVIGPLLGIQALAPLMPPGGGSIVNVGSIAALIAHYPVAYTTSKWGLRGLNAVASLDLGARGVRVNMIHPGFIETEMTASASDAFRDVNIEQTPLGRTGLPAEVGPLVVFLISDESSYITGAEIPVDGGLSAHRGAKAIADRVLVGGR